MGMTIERPRIISRYEWTHAKPGGVPYRDSTKLSSILKYVTIHHTAGAAPFDKIDVLNAVRDIAYEHTVGQGWGDIGYHFLISPSGIIVEGSPIDRRGAHVQAHNTGNVGIALMGNYSKRELTKIQELRLIQLVAWLCHRYDIPPDHILGHKKWLPTECPGNNVDLDMIRQEVRERLTPSPKPSLVVGPVTLPALIVDGRLCVEVRKLARLLGARIKWNNEKKQAVWEKD